MSIVNLQRDAVFVDVDKTPIIFPAGTGFFEGIALIANTDSTVHDDYLNIRSSRTDFVGLVVDQIKSIGGYLRPPGDGLSPYRVKAYGDCRVAAIQFHVCIGWGPDVIDGSDLIDEWIGIPFDTNIDELVMVPPEITEDHALFFGIGVSGITGSDAPMHAWLSVQRLATAPPQFDQSVS